MKDLDEQFLPFQALRRLKPPREGRVPILIRSTFPLEYDSVLSLKTRNFAKRVVLDGKPSAKIELLIRRHDCFGNHAARVSIMDKSLEQIILVLLAKEGLEAKEGDLEKFGPLVEQYVATLKSLREVDVGGEEIAGTFRPERK